MYPAPPVRDFHIFKKFIQIAPPFPVFYFLHICAVFDPVFHWVVSGCSTLVSLGNYLSSVDNVPRHVHWDAVC